MALCLALPTSAAGATRPDLIVKSGSVQAAGGMITGSFVVARNGISAAPISYAAISVMTGQQRQIVKRIGINRLKQTSSRRASIHISVPAGLSIGSHLVEACADARNKIAERSESNNCRMIGTVEIPMALAPLVSPLTPLMNALPARSFVDSAGVNMQIPGDRSSTWPAKLAALREMNVRHLRVTIPGSPENQAIYQEIASSGIGLDLIGHTSNQCDQAAADRVVALMAPFGSSIESIEGPNEWDLFHADHSIWASCLAEYQRHLYQAVKSTPELASITVIGPSLGDPSMTPSVPSMVGAMDYANLHTYSFGEAPESVLDKAFAFAKSTPAPKGWYATEAGFHNSFINPWIQPPVSESVAAQYITRTVAENFRRNITRTYLWTFNDFTDPLVGWPDQEAHFGLVRPDLTPKPAGLALGRLLRMVDDKPGDFKPEPLRVKVEGSDDVHTVLLQKQDGVYMLLIWRAVSVWDTQSLREVAPPAKQIRITLDQPLFLAKADVADNDHWQSLGLSKQLDLQMAGQLVVVRLHQSEPPSAPL